MTSATLRARIDQLNDMKAVIREELLEANQAGNTADAAALTQELRNVGNAITSVQVELHLNAHPEKRWNGRKKVQTTLACCPDCGRKTLKVEVVEKKDVTHAGTVADKDLEVGARLHH